MVAPVPLALLFFAQTGESALPPLTLEGAIEAAMTDAQEILRAKDDVLLADVDRMRSIAAILPSVSVSAGANEYFYGEYFVEARRNYYGPFTDLQDSFSHPSFNFAFNARQVIWDGGRAWAQLGRSKDIKKFRESALAAVQANLRLLVVRRFFDLAKATRGVETFSVQVKFAEDQLKRALENLEKGKVKVNDVAAAERNLASDRVTLARRVFTESTRARFLNLSIGREPDTLFRLVIPREVETTTVSLRPIVIPRTERLIEEAERRRPEITGSLANLEILRRNLDIRSADEWPIIGFNLGYSKFSRRPDRVYTDPTINYFALLGLDVRYNVLGDLTTSASIQEGELELDKARVLHEDLLRQVRSEVLEKIEQLRLLAQVFELNRAGTRAAEEVTRQVAAAYREGRATLLEVRDAEFRLITARDSIYEARFDIEVAIEELRRAVGADVLDRSGVPVQEINGP